MNKKEVQHIPVLGDGDCLFHSITNYLHIDKNRKKYKDKTYSYTLNELSNQQWSKLSMNLRRKVVRWLRDNLDYEMPTGLTIRDEINEDLDYSESDQDINGYLRKMNKSGEYGGQIEITAISNILNRNVKTFISKGGKYSNVGLGYKINEDRNSDILIYHNMGKIKSKGLHHFEVLYPKDKSIIIPLEKYNQLFKEITKKKLTKRRSKKFTKRRKKLTKRRSKFTKRRKKLTKRRKKLTKRRSKLTKRN